MDKLLRKSFILLGLTEKEVKFLEALYELGPSTIQDVVKVSHLQRSTSYLLMQQLLEKGFIQEDFKGYKKKIIAVEPQTLLRLLTNRQRTLHRHALEFQEHLPELEVVFKTTRIKPHIQYFQGKKAIRSLWEDVLKTENEILLWTNQATENLFFSQALHELFIKERVSKRVPIRALAVHNQPGKSLLEKDMHSMRQSKLLPIQTTFRAETYIYDSKVAILDYQNDNTGIIIESDSNTSTQRAIFEMTWNSIK